MSDRNRVGSIKIVKRTAYNTAPQYRSLYAIGGSARLFFLVLPGKLALP